ncbi:hypothetical protein K435DRAFT_869387 [Dendrothele bispora CBS 962.96]|uniref:Uncharacterized protein n=1 Tax=Dendrothele bispora (strain CBS 962.96) TaxID=1314807 RepID=A0A4S8L9A3_DENBC|nr:hypothetical protein K435DRAFT_869387 [Dendrothele bispora CBS 962.96]
MGWNELLDQHIVGMQDLQDSEKKKIKAAKGHRAAAARSAREGNTPVEGAREKHRTPSWIWHGVSEGELGVDKVLYDAHEKHPPLLQNPYDLGLRIEWCKSYARVRRWREEVMLLQEEMRRCLVTLEWQATTWKGRAVIPNFEGERLEGSTIKLLFVGILQVVSNRFGRLSSEMPSVNSIDVEEVSDDEDDDDDPMDGRMGLDAEPEEEALIGEEDLDEEGEEDGMEEDQEEERLEEERDSDHGMEADFSDDELNTHGHTLKEMLVSLEEEQTF